MPHFSQQLGGSFNATQFAATPGATSAVLVASNPARVAVTIVNTGTTAWLGYGATAQLNVSFPIPSGFILEETVYKGPINAVIASNGGPPGLLITDITAP